MRATVAAWACQPPAMPGDFLMAKRQPRRHPAGNNPPIVRLSPEVLEYEAVHAALWRLVSEGNPRRVASGLHPQAWRIHFEGRRVSMLSVLRLALEKHGVETESGLKAQLRPRTESEDGRWRQQLKVIGFPPQRGHPEDAGPLRRLSFVAIRREHVEDAARELHAAGLFREGPDTRDCRWRVQVGPHWYVCQALMTRAAVAAHQPEPEEATFRYNLGQRWRQKLHALGFRTNRDSRPTAEFDARNHARIVRQVHEQMVIDARARMLSAALTTRVAAGAPAESLDVGSGTLNDLPVPPLQVVVGGHALPAHLALGRPAGTPLSPEDEAAIAAAGGMLRAPADPEDAEADALVRDPALSSAVRRMAAGRLGQGTFREGLIARHGACVVTGARDPKVLRAAHLKRWADSDDDPVAKYHLDNGLLLRADVDALFEAGRISFDHEGRLLLQAGWNPQAEAGLALDPLTLRLPFSISEQRLGYLNEHGQRHGFPVGSEAPVARPSSGATRKDSAGRPNTPPSADSHD